MGASFACSLRFCLHALFSRVCTGSGCSTYLAGDLDTLLSAYDRDRRTLPAPVEPWTWGWTKSAETWNGRIAMVAIIVILLLEATTGQSFLNNIMAID